MKRTIELETIVVLKSVVEIPEDCPSCKTTLRQKDAVTLIGYDVYERIASVVTRQPDDLVEGTLRIDAADYIEPPSGDSIRTAVHCASCGEQVAAAVEHRPTTLLEEVLMLKALLADIEERAPKSKKARS